MITFYLHPIVDGRCGCGDPECTQAGKHPAERWSKVPLDRPELQPTETKGVGIATGTKSGCFVVDLDTKNGVDGIANFQALGAIPPTYTVATPSGGFHLYFKHPGFFVKTSAGQLAPGIDIRGDGGYVVAPGSPHKNGGRYTIARDLPIAEAPAWLLARSELRKTEAAVSEPAAEAEARYAHIPREFRIARAKEWLAKEPAAVSGNGGHGAAMRAIASATRGFALTDEGMVREAIADWNARCIPPWKGQELAHKIDEAIHRSTVPWNAQNVDMQDTLAQAASTVAAPQEQAPAPAKVLTAAERALRMADRDVTRLQTGLATIDSVTRGGILRRKVVVVGGAPGAGKTALLVRLAYTWLEQSVHVGILASDEEADGLLVRLGQLHGLSRDALERGDRDATRTLADWCRSVPLLLRDGDEDEKLGTIDALSRDLRAQAGGNMSALLVDSIQTARCDVESPKGADTRAKIDGIVRSLKRCAKVDGHVVFASSELSRAAYRNKDAAENVNALAAFKESGAIEYGVSLGLVLASRQGTSEIVDAEVVKNRLGPGKPTFVLRLDHDRANVQETTDFAIKATDPLFDTKCAVVEAVTKAAGVPLSRNQIAARVTGGRNRVLKAVSYLLEAGILREEPNGIRIPIPGDPEFVLTQ